MLIYAFADLRAVGREGKLTEDEQKMLALPVDASQIINVVSANIQDLKDHIKFGEETDFYLSSLTSLQKSLQKHAVDPSSGEAVYHFSQVVDFDDENSESELVYGIAVNSARKRITVCFRGSVTQNDFITDAKGFLTDIPNPVVSSGGNTVAVHHGFRGTIVTTYMQTICCLALSSHAMNSSCVYACTEYLFGPGRQRRGVEAKQSKYEKITNKVLELLEEHPGFKVYVTGHSLGGALSTLFAFSSAADSRMPKPVTCINIASPKVGGLSFRRAYHTLEQEGALRSLRIANHKDLVTLLPDSESFSCLYIACCQGSVFRHVGTELKLYKNGSFQFFRPTETTSCLGQFCQDWSRQAKNAVLMILTLPFMLFCQEDFLKYHACREYMDRLQKGSEKTQHMHLNTLHQDGHHITTTN